MAPGSGSREPIRSRILQSAAALFAEQGYDQTTTREIATAARLELAELFHRFASKDDIMNTLLKEDLDAAMEAAEKQLREPGSAAVRFYRYLLVDLETASRSPFNLAGVTRPAVRRELSFAGARARHRRLFDARVGMISQGMESGEFAPVDPGAAGQAVEWTIEGMLAEIAESPPGDLQSYIREITDFCLRALLSDSDQLTAVREEALKGLTS